MKQTNKQTFDLVSFLPAEKVPSDATFFGAQYLSYNLSSRGNVLDSNQDEVSLDFRTKQADGLLFYTGRLLLTCYFFWSFFIFFILRIHISKCIDLIY